MNLDMYVDSQGLDLAVDSVWRGDFVIHFKPGTLILFSVLFTKNTPNHEPVS